jgi:hypothetical protein
LPEAIVTPVRNAKRLDLITIAMLQAIDSEWPILGVDGIGLGYITSRRNYMIEDLQSKETYVLSVGQIPQVAKGNFTQITITKQANQGGFCAITAMLL